MSSIKGRSRNAAPSSAVGSSSFAASLNAEEGRDTFMKPEKPKPKVSPQHEATGNGGSLSGTPARYNVTIFGQTYNRVVMMVHFNIFIYAMCFWIQIGTLPYLTKKLGVNTVQFGYLQTTFAIVQLAGGPLFGRFGDLYGGRAALTLAFASSTLTYGLLGLASNIPFLFLSRMPSVFMHAMQGGQMVVTDMAEKTKRADSLGKLGISYGVGMVVGPFVGGLITKNFDEQSAAYVACAGSLVCVFLCQTFIPAHTKIAHAATQEHGSSTDSTSIFSIKKIMSLLANRRAALLLAVKAVTGVPIGIFQSMFSVIAMETFELGPAQNGYIMSYIGVLSMIVQGFGIKALTSRMAEMSVIKVGVAVLVFAYLGLAFVLDVWMLCVVLVPMTIGLTLVNVVITSAMTNCVAHTDTGAMLGVNMAVNSLIRTVSPTIGGYMLNSLGFSSFGYLGFINSLLVAVFLLLRVKE